MSDSITFSKPPTPTPIEVSMSTDPTTMHVPVDIEKLAQAMSREGWTERTRAIALLLDWLPTNHAVYAERNKWIAQLVASICDRP